MSKSQQGEFEEFICPANPYHKLKGALRFERHIYSCDQLKDKKVFLCKYSQLHMFMDENERDTHEEMHCKEKKDGVDRKKNYLFIKKTKEDLEMERPKKLNILESQSYYFKNKTMLEDEKRMKQIIREQKKLEQLQLESSNVEQAKNQNTYNNDLLQAQEEKRIRLKFQNTILSFPMMKTGLRPIRNQLFSVEDTIKIPKDRLKSITNFQYEKLLLCEFILTPQSTQETLNESLEKNPTVSLLQEKITIEETAGSTQFEQITDETLIIVDKEICPSISNESTHCLIVLRASEFKKNADSIHLPETYSSNFFDTNYTISQNLKDLVTYNDRISPNELKNMDHKRNIKGLIKWRHDTEVDKIRLQNRFYDEIEQYNKRFESTNNEQTILRKEHEGVQKNWDGLKKQYQEFAAKEQSKCLRKVDDRKAELNRKINEISNKSDEKMESFQFTSIKIESENQKLHDSNNDFKHNSKNWD